MTVNDILKLLALRGDCVYIAEYDSGKELYEGLVKHVPDSVRSRTPKLLKAFENLAGGTTYIINVEENE